MKSIPVLCAWYVVSLEFGVDCSSDESTINYKIFVQSQSAFHILITHLKLTVSMYYDACHCIFSSL